MWIALSILAFLAIIITLILLLPLKVIIRNDENNQLILRYKLLFKTFGENPNPNDPIVKTLKKAGGLERLERAITQPKAALGDLKETVSEAYSVLTDLLKELVFLLKNCTVTKLKLTICCADEEPDQAAIQYGLCTAATSALLTVLRSFLRIRKRGCHIRIHCDYSSSKSVFRYHVVLAVPFYRALAAFWRAALAEAKRDALPTQDQSK